MPRSRRNNHRRSITSIRSTTQSQPHRPLSNEHAPPPQQPLPDAHVQPQQPRPTAQQEFGAMGSHPDGRRLRLEAEDFLGRRELEARLLKVGTCIWGVRIQMAGARELVGGMMDREMAVVMIMEAVIIMAATTTMATATSIAAGGDVEGEENGVGIEVPGVAEGAEVAEEIGVSEETEGAEEIGAAEE
ncbi:hypothetical protein VE03_09102 [Pseudogymnoascus sp. 23342-1-I1]|nr:hypothetical protein VE03_09102 [Pseudogymnoascus sp. 23342-1-I1]